MLNEKSTLLCIIISLFFSGLSWGHNYGHASAVIKYDVPDVNCVSALLEDNIQYSNELNFYDINIADANDGKLWVTWLEFVPDDDPNFPWRHSGIGDCLWAGKGVWDVNDNWQWEENHPLDFSNDLGVSNRSYSHPTVTMAGNTTWLTYESQDPNGWHIYAGQITSDPNVFFNLKCITSGINNNINHQVAPLPSGDIIITWQQDNSGQFDIALCKVYSDLSLSDVKQISDPNTGDWRPDIAMTDAGKICMVWDSYINEAEGFNVLARWGDANSLVFDPDIYVVADDPNDARFQGKAQVVLCEDNNAWIIWEEGSKNWGKRYTSINGDNSPDASYNNATDEFGPLHSFRRIKFASLIQSGQITEFAVPMDMFGNIEDTGEPREGIEDLGIYYEGGMITLDNTGRIWIAYRHFSNEYCRRKLEDMYTKPRDEETIRCIYEKGWKIYARCFNGNDWSQLYATSNSDPNGYYIYQQRDGMQRMSLCAYDANSITVAWDIGRTERDRTGDKDSARGICLTKAEYVTPIALEDPEVHWELDETSGTTASDSGDYSINGTLYSSPQWTAAVKQNGLLFNGSDDYVNVPCDPNLNPVDFAIAFWARVDGGPNTYRTPVCSRYAEQNGSSWICTGYNVYASNDNEWEFWTGNGTGFEVIEGPPVIIGDWTHIAITFEAISDPDPNGVYTGIKKLYVNGNLEASAIAGKYKQNSVTPFNLGRMDQKYNSNYYFDGCLDDVRIYNCAFSSNQIANLYNSFGLSQQSDSLAEVESKAALETCNVGGREYTLTFGDLHRHTDFSRCLPYFDGSIEDAYRYGMDVAALSFMSITDHSWDMDNGNMNSQIYWRYRKEYSRHQLSDNFTAFFGYERGKDNPHSNFIFKDLNDTPPYLDKLIVGDAADDPLKDYLSDLDPSYNFTGNAMAIPHRTGNSDPNWDIDEIAMPLIEVYQGCRDDVENVSAFEDGIFNNGYHIGAIASSDHLSTSSSYACVWAEENSRESVFEAMKKRRTYGATDKITLIFTTTADANTYWMGDRIVTDQEPVFTINVKTNKEKENAVISSCTIYSDFNENGQPIFVPADANEFTCTFTPSRYSWNWADCNEHVLYVKVTQDDDNNGTDDNTAWSSPIWSECQQKNAHWQFDETAGTTASDSSLNGYDGTLNGNPTWSAGVIDGALEFDGDDYIEIDGASTGTGYNGISDALPRTVTGWIKTDVGGTIVSWGEPEELGRWCGVLVRNDHLTFSVWDGYAEGNIDVADDNWHHIAVVLNPENPTIGGISLYVDGVLEQNEDIYFHKSDRNVNTLTSTPVQIGRIFEDEEYQNPGYYFEGFMDDFRIYNYALSESEIGNMLTVAHWKLDETQESSIAYDFIGNNDANLTNGPVWDPNGVLDGGLLFDGSDDYADVQYDPIFNPVNFTIAFWARVDGGQGTYRTPVCSRYAENLGGGSWLCTGYNVYASNDNEWEFWTGNGTGFEAIEGPSVEVGAWTHIVVSFEVNSGPDVNGVYTGTKKLYVDGNLEASTITGKYKQNSVTPFNLGRMDQDYNSNYYFNGCLDDVHVVYNRVLNQTEIQDLASMGQ